MKQDGAANTEAVVERYRLSNEAGRVGTWDWDVQNERFWSSEETARLYGLDEGETLSYGGWMERVHPEDRERVEGVMREALAEGSSYEIDFRLRPPDRPTAEQRWVWARGSAHFDRNGDAVRVLASHIDITSRKLLEKRADQTEAELRRVNELKDDFLAMLGHELRNPLGAIINGIELLQSNQGEEHRQWAEEMIDRQAQQLKRLVDDILEISRVARGKLEIRPEVVSLDACVESARDAVRERFQEHPREVRVQLPAERIHLFADPARMEQILGNLLSNSIKYTEEGGRIELSAERRGDEVLIRVSDDGEGLSQKHLETVFEPFVRVSSSLPRAGSGLGIGLTLVRRLVELHDGSVSVESEGPGKGCTFTVALPFHEGEPAAHSESAPGARGSLRILVIDDHKDLAVGLKKRLEDEGHDVTLAHDGPEGIEAARRIEPHLVLVDVGLPSMDGYRVAKTLRAELPTGTRVAGISGFKERGEEDRAAEVFDHYFLKPVDAEQLKAWIAQTCAEVEDDEESHEEE